ATLQIVDRIKERRAPTSPQSAPPPPSQIGYVPPAGLLPWFTPLKIAVDPALAATPHLNGLVPGVAMKHNSGGPNTSVNLAYSPAEMGVPVRFVSTDVPPDADLNSFWHHVLSLAGSSKRLNHVSVVDAFGPDKPLTIGVNDVFMATA